jgi:hypothetical protein
MQAMLSLKEIAAACGLSYDSARALTKTQLAERGFERVAYGKFKRRDEAADSAADIGELKRQKLMRETELLSQKVRDNSAAAYYGWVEHLREKALPAITEYRNTVENLGLTEEQRTAINGAFHKWITDTFAAMLTELPQGLQSQAWQASD